MPSSPVRVPLPSLAPIWAGARRRLTVAFHLLPALAATSVTVSHSLGAPDPLRTLWQIGTDSPAGSSVYSQYSEFSSQNNINDARPGRVTRLPGDPQFAGTANPGRDDDFYFAGEYPFGFNLLSAPLIVPNDEPASAWEHSHTIGDRTNRIHFVLDASQTLPQQLFRLTIDLPYGQSMVGGVLQPGFSVHDYAVRFRNASGVATTLYSSRISQASILILDFAAPTVAASPGPNSIELVRTGPTPPGTSTWLVYDCVRIEALPQNQAPVFNPVDDLAVDVGTALAFNLSAVDEDLPAQSLSYSRVSGPPGLGVSPSGELTWTPGPEAGSTIHSVTVQVTDSGTPPLSAIEEFQIAVNGATGPIRALWQIGTDSPPGSSVFSQYSEFSGQNNINDARPGRVTRLPGDPQYSGTANPGRDDDFYFAGEYPSGFNLLSAPLSVPNDEPASAWEHSHTIGDRTNRIHFVLDASQTLPQQLFRLTVDLPYGQSMVGGVLQPGFSVHDYAVRFRNASGVATTLYSSRISQASILILDFAAPTVAASPGPNSIELVRTGPVQPGTSTWLVYDCVRIEALPSGPLPGTAGFVWIPPGTFTMGSPETEEGRNAAGHVGEAQHDVTLSRGFWLCDHEVTQSEYAAVVGINPVEPGYQGAHLPVGQISWTEAVAYCALLTAQERTAGRLPEGYAYRLPTEAEWEYACRAGSTGPYAGDVDLMAWFGDTYPAPTHPVKTKLPNAWGLHDMHGNVWEWVSDWLGEYPAGSVTDPAGPESGIYRACRGGSCFRDALVCRSANRDGDGPGYRVLSIGLRTALSQVSQ